MKNVLLGLGLGAVTLIAISCKKDKAVNCNDAAKAVVDAGTKYSTDFSAANCKAYKAAVQTYISSDCFSGVSADQKAMYQEMFDELDCE